MLKLPERPGTGIEGEPRPASAPYVDLEHRELHIARHSIQSWMLVTRRLEYGKYGTSRYGRCLYGVRVGIYGADRYGSATYF